MSSRDQYDEYDYHNEAAGRRMPDAVREAALRFHASVTDAMNAAADDAKVRASTSYDGVAVDGSHYAIAVMVIHAGCAAGDVDEGAARRVEITARGDLRALPVEQAIHERRHEKRRGRRGRVRLSAGMISDAPRRSRTPNLLIRSQTLYPVELWARMGGTRFELVTSTMST